MDANSKRELAQAIVKTNEIREASQDHATGAYKLNYYEAFQLSGADPDLQDVVTSLLIAGYCASWDWAVATANKTKQKAPKDTPRLIEISPKIEE
jgi:hypothetical protein